MYKIILLLTVLIFTGCEDHTASEIEQITAYYKGFQDSDFNQIKETIADSITLVEGSYKMAYSKEGFHEHFKWDSVFNPSYQVVKIEPKEDQYVAEISVSSSRFKFLKNNPLVSKQRFYFKSGQINRIENVGFIGTDWQQWTAQKEALIGWIAIHHPELDGFINDLTMQGGIDYLQAIKLYQNRERS